LAKIRNLYSKIGQNGRKFLKEAFLGEFRLRFFGLKLHDSAHPAIERKRVLSKIRKFVCLEFTTEDRPNANGPFE